jgi:hypothetical protein
MLELRFFPNSRRCSMLKNAREVISPVLGRPWKALVHAARRSICSSTLKSGRSIPPRSRPFDVTRPQVFGARAMSFRRMRRRSYRCVQQERSRKPRILANACTNSECTPVLVDQKLARNWPSILRLSATMMIAESQCRMACWMWTGFAIMAGTYLATCPKLKSDLRSAWSEMVMVAALLYAG